MSEKFSDAATRIVVNVSAGVRKRDYLNNIAWEFWKGGVPSAVEFVLYHNVELAVGNVVPSQIPAHPTALALGFSDVQFSEQQGPVYLERCPKLQTLFIVNCHGKLQLRNLRVKYLVIGSAADYSSFQLVNSSVENIIMLPEFVQKAAGPEKEFTAILYQVLQNPQQRFDQLDVSPAISNQILDVGDTQNLQTRFERHGLLYIKDYSNSARKQEQLTNIAWEHFKGGVPTYLKYIYMRNIELTLGANSVDQPPAHPTLEQIAFNDVVFAGGVRLERSPGLRTVIIAGCTGKIELRGLQLSKIVVGSASDFNCFALVNSTVEQIVPMEQFAAPFQIPHKPDTAEFFDSYFHRLLRPMVQTETKLAPEIRSLQIGDGQNMCNRFERAGLEFISNYGQRQRKTEYLTNIAWEHFKGGLQTTVKFIWFRNLDLQPGNTQGTQRPAHPTLEVFALQDVQFAGGCALEKSPKLREVFLSNCTGKLILKDLTLKRLVLGVNADFMCFTLVNTTVEEMMTAEQYCAVAKMPTLAGSRFFEALFAKLLGGAVFTAPEQPLTKAFDQQPVQPIQKFEQYEAPLIDKPKPQALKPSETVMMGDGRDMCDSFDREGLKTVIDFGEKQRKKEFLNNIAWEALKTGHKTIVSTIVFHFAHILLGRVEKGQLPAHPTLQSVAFSNVFFDNQTQGPIYLERCPALRTVFVVGCQSKIILKGLKLERIVIGADADRGCYELVGSTVGQIVYLQNYVYDVQDCDYEAVEALKKFM